MLLPSGVTCSSVNAGFSLNYVPKFTFPLVFDLLLPEKAGG